MARSNEPVVVEQVEPGVNEIEFEHSSLGEDCTQILKPLRLAGFPVVVPVT